MSRWIHRSLELDEATQRVRCAECGWVTAAWHHNRWSCANAKAQQRGKHVPRDGAQQRTQEGYVRIARGGRYQLQHRLVMQEMLGRELRPDENVHHVNGDRADNRPENLELWSTSQPPGQRIADKVAWAREIISLYG